MNKKGENLMKKTKTQKAITLIALIITIVVLLILAAVAISSITNDGILSYAQNAAKDYNQAQSSELGILGKYELFLEANSKKFKENGTINGEEYGAYNPIIPKGFAPINTVTSNWNATDLAAEVKKGLVISDGTSEFVWIPVPILDDFARLQDGSETNYRGVLYDLTSDSTGATEYSWASGYANYREPANLLSDTTTNLSIWTETLYQENFNEMVESVGKYKGFYVGRYETSLNGSGKAQSVLGEIPMNNINWFKMYENSLTYANEENKNLGVISQMIWGCQWDAMLKFILTGTEAEHVTEKTNVGHIASEFATKPYCTGGTNYNSVYTGNTSYNDIASNIYDLEGNVIECTQAMNNQYGNYRVTRGGNYGSAWGPAPIGITNPTENWKSVGSRLSLYVEI